jgi:hypothetical protein
MFGEGDDFWRSSAGNFIHTDGQTHHSTNISASVCQFHSYFLWMGKTRNSCESATIEMCAAVRKCMLVSPSKWHSFDTQAKQQPCCKAGNLSLFHKRTAECKEQRHCPVQFLFHRFAHATAPGRGWAPHVHELIRCVLLLQQHETREYTTNPK